MCGVIDADGALIRGLAVDASMTSDHLLITAALDPAVEQGEGNYGIVFKLLAEGVIETVRPANARAVIDLQRCLALVEGHIRGKFDYDFVVSDMLKS